jgi:hypothetical protein
LRRNQSFNFCFDPWLEPARLRANFFASYDGFFALICPSALPLVWVCFFAFAVGSGPWGFCGLRPLAPLLLPIEGLGGFDVPVAFSAVVDFDVPVACGLLPVAFSAVTCSLLPVTLASDHPITRDHRITRSPMDSSLAEGPLWRVTCFVGHHAPGNPALL